MNDADLKLMTDFLEDLKWHPEFEGVDLSKIAKISICGNNLLHVAAIKNRPDVCKILINLGLDVNQRGEHGYTPLHEAAEQGNEEVYSMLVRFGADVNQKNRDGISPAELRDLMK
jgi:ankyrin repeat protein